MQQRAAADRLLLNLPALGPCLYCVAMSRFTLALQLTLDSGLAIAKALRLSLKATANAAFAERADVVVQALKRGETLYEALADSRLFTIDFLNIVASAEEGGRVPEMMRHQAEYYQEETSRQLTTLTRVATGVVWVGYAGFMIWMIMRIAGVYLGALDGR
jgi:type II secretory pathway component PulF